MSQPSQADLAALKQQLINLLSQEKSRNDAIAAANDDLRDQIRKSALQNGKLQRKNKQLEGHVGMLEKKIEYLNGRILRMENMVDQAESQRDALLRGTGEFNEDFERDLRKTHRDEVFYWTDALDSAMQHIRELEGQLEHRNFRIDELLDKVIGLHEKYGLRGGNGVDVEERAEERGGR